MVSKLLRMAKLSNNKKEINKRVEMKRNSLSSIAFCCGEGRVDRVDRGAILLAQKCQYCNEPTATDIRVVVVVVVVVVVAEGNY